MEEESKNEIIFRRFSSFADRQEPKSIAQELNARNLSRMLEKTVESGDSNSCHKFILSSHQYNAHYCQKRGVCCPLNERIM